MAYTSLKDNSCLLRQPDNKTVHFLIINSLYL